MPFFFLRFREQDEHMVSQNALYSLNNSCHVEYGFPCEICCVLGSVAGTLVSGSTCPPNPGGLTGKATR